MTTSKAQRLADELIAVSMPETLARWAAEGDLSSLRQHEALMRARLGGDYDPAAWDEALRIVEALADDVRRA